LVPAIRARTSPAPPGPDAGPASTDPGPLEAGAGR
jgi:hypothetical protein